MMRHGTKFLTTVFGRDFLPPDRVAADSGDHDRYPRIGLPDSAVALVIFSIEAGP